VNSSTQKKLGGSVILRQAGDSIRTLPKSLITAQERLRRKGRAILRVILATAFLWLTTLFSIGIQLTASVSQAKESVKKRTKGQMKLRKVSESKNSSINGVASWYGKGFHGRRTASGVRFNQNAMMAAHKTLPFGTILRVTNLTNNKSCYVEVTDRGPYIKGRELDLSLAAANELGFKHAGIAQISMEIVNDNIADYYKQIFFRDNMRQEARMMKAAKAAAGGVLAAAE
jgi:rare lipoprotein A (peptidoglycan hydrolase)